jgi:hypothetical protein
VFRLRWRRAERRSRHQPSGHILNFAIIATSSKVIATESCTFISPPRAENGVTP